MTQRIKGQLLLLHGPNLDQLGRRDPVHYGRFTLDTVEDVVRQAAADFGYDIRAVQSNHEGDLIEALHAAPGKQVGILINAGALTHTSYALRDALELTGLPAIEIHISDVARREAFRRVSVLRELCLDHVSGLGLAGYRLATERLCRHLDAGGDQPPASAPEPLAGLREQIDHVDTQLMALFDQRMGLAEQVAAYKLASGQPVYDRAREQAHLADLVTKHAVPRPTQSSSFLTGLMRLSRTVQYQKLLEADRPFELGRLLEQTQANKPQVQRVVTQGTAGAYSELACRLLFPTLEPARVQTFQQACEAVGLGHADAAVLPLENSTAGTVDAVYDALMDQQLYIWEALALTIHHQLLVKPGTTLDDIQVVLSHPQALAQCSHFLSRQGWTLRETQNTAFAAEQVAASHETGWAAIASAQAAHANGLSILCQAISNTALNQTRFIVVGKTFQVAPEADRISLVLQLPHTTGTLAATLSVFSDWGLNLSKIQSRPDPDQPWHYLFYLDFVCRRADLARAKTVLFHLVSEMPLVRFLGWYHEQEALSLQEDAKGKTHD